MMPNIARAATIMAALALSQLALNAPAVAATTIDNFQLVNLVGFPAVSATQTSTVANGTSTNGTILGGERDITVEALNPVGYVGDNGSVQAVARNGYFGPFNASLLTMAIGLGGEARFTVTYDGAGTGSAAAGLNLDAASLGDAIRIVYFENRVLGPGGAVPTDLSVRLTDGAGKTATLTRTMAANAYGVLTPLTYGFAQFEAANALLDLRSIDSIQIISAHRMESALTSSVSLTGIGIEGRSYTPTNVIPPVSAVPEPASWAMMMTGFGLAGMALRRRAWTLATA